MKTFIASILVMVLMLTGFGIYIYYLTNTTEELVALINTISDLAKDENWEDCNSKVDNLMELWNRHEKVLCSFTDHGDLDEVKRSMNELKESARYNDSQDTVMYSSVLLVLIDRLTENELPTLENILKTNTQIYLRA